METGILKSNNMFNDKEKFGSTENDRDKKKNWIKKKTIKLSLERTHEPLITKNKIVLENKPSIIVCFFKVLKFKKKLSCLAKT